MTPIQILYCYSPEDKPFRDQLDTQLRVLKRLGKMTLCLNREVLNGASWKNGEGRGLQRADLVLLLISPNFIHSHYHFSLEMSDALQKHRVGIVWVTPIILRPSLWRETPFGKLQALPKDGRSLTEQKNREEAIFDIVKGISEIVTIILTRKQKLAFATGLSEGVSPNAPERRSSHCISCEAHNPSERTICEHCGDLLLSTWQPSILSSAQIWIEKGLAMERQQRNAEALDAYTRALNCEPNSVEALCKSGNVLTKMYQSFDALWAYDRALKITPQNRTARLGKTHALSQLGRYDQVLEEYDKILEDDPHYTAAQRGKAKTLYQLKRYEQALETYESILKSGTGNITDWHGKAETLCQLKRYEQALEAIEKAIENLPENPLLFHCQVTIYCQLKNYTQALETIERILSIDPKDAIAWFGKAEALYQLGHSTQALQAYEKAKKFLSSVVNPLNDRKNTNISKGL